MYKVIKSNEKVCRIYDIPDKFVDYLEYASLSVQKIECFQQFVYRCGIDLLKTTQNSFIHSTCTTMSNQQNELRNILHSTELYSQKFVESIQNSVDQVRIQLEKFDNLSKHVEEFQSSISKIKALNGLISEGTRNEPSSGRNISAAEMEQLKTDYNLAARTKSTIQFWNSESGILLRLYYILY